MSLKVRCPACRKQVPVQPSDAGHAVLCLACGHSFRAPEFLTESIDEPVAAAVDGAGAGVDEIPAAGDVVDDDDIVPGFPVAGTPPVFAPDAAPPETRNVTEALPVSASTATPPPAPT